MKQAQPVEFLLTEAGNLLPVPSEYIHGPEMYRVRVRQRPGRKPRNQELDGKIAHAACVHTTFTERDAGKPLRPSPGVHGLGPIAVWYLYVSGQDLHEHLSPAAYLYYRRTLRNLCGLDICIPLESCLVTPSATAPVSRDLPESQRVKTSKGA